MNGVRGHIATMSSPNIAASDESPLRVLASRCPFLVTL
jgi:hypothetical protein